MFRPAAKLLTGPAGTARVRLTGKESALLRLLCRAEEAAVPRRALLDAAWGNGRDISARALDICVHGLRRKIESDPSRPRLLTTVSGGHRLDAASDADRLTFREAFRSEAGV